MRLAWRVDALDKWRTETDNRLHDHDEAIRKMVTAQEIAEAVAARLSARNRFELTLGQKLIGLVFAGASFASILHGLGAF